MQVREKVRGERGERGEREVQMERPRHREMERRETPHWIDEVSVDAAAEIMAMAMIMVMGKRKRMKVI